MDLVTRTVTRGGRSFWLTAREFALLELFMQNPGRVLSRTTIAERIWDSLFRARYESSRSLHGEAQEETRGGRRAADFQNVARRGLSIAMRSLGSRLTLWYVLVIGLTVAVILVAGRWLLWYELIRGVDLLNRAEYQEIVDRVEKTTPAVTEEEMLRRIDAHAKIDAPLYFFQLRDRSGQVVFRSENMNDTTFPANPPGAENWTFPMKDDDEARTASFPIGNLRLQIAASLQNPKELLRAYVQVCFVLLGIALVLSVFFGHRLSRMALDPVRRIQRTANRIRAGNLSERIPADNGKDEIADLARLLNRMFDRLELSFTRLWRFSADASHELRTPLSLIRLQSEKLLLHGDLEPMQAGGRSTANREYRPPEFGHRQAALFGKIRERNCKDEPYPGKHTRCDKGIRRRRGSAL